MVLLDGAQSTLDFSFVAGEGTVTVQDQIDAAMIAVGAVRDMAATDGVPLPGTGLRETVLEAFGSDEATCLSFSQTLLKLFVQVGITAPARQADVCLKENEFDCHTLTELQNSENGRWILLDPTFALIARKAESGEFSSVSELSVATRALELSKIEYEFVGGWDDEFARRYYLDYPILFANVVRPETEEPAR